MLGHGHNRDSPAFPLDDDWLRCSIYIRACARGRKARCRTGSESVNYSLWTAVTDVIVSKPYKIKTCLP
jgi:hypothetical protein